MAAENYAIKTNQTKAKGDNTPKISEYRSASIDYVLTEIKRWITY